jgi:eukaryotic-like serine/threonine-protein kinase
MNSEKWRIVKTTFNQALELKQSERVAFVEDKLKNDTSAMQEVLAMLAAENEQDKSAINLSAILANNVDELLESQNILSPGEILDNFVVLSSIGKGGMGSVFLAQRKIDDFEQYVAIKVIHEQQVNIESIERFRRERQILASLNHRNIASFIGGGETKRQLPYIILEYVVGTPIIAYCQQHNLDIDTRLQLFKQVLNAVSYAHQHLVVHRDIKPSNVLVTDTCDVKLLDFGIAKLLQRQDAAEINELTRDETRLLTPGNASPEQVLGGHISTRTDIYGLGTLLMHMLTDEAIFNTTNNTQREIETLILEQTPLKPSQKCAQSTVPEIRARVKLLRGDLDTIVMKALQKDPLRRYSTVEQFSDDINRYQQNYPISAKPDKLLYKVNKFIKRNTLSSALAALIVVSLITFTSLLAIQSKQIQHERDNALNEAAVSQQIATFMTDIFDASDPNINDGQDISANTILLNATDKLNELDSTPEIKAKLLITLGKVNRVLSQYEQAKNLLNEADKLIPQKEKISVVSTLIDRINVDIELAALAYETGQYAVSEQVYHSLLVLLAQHKSVLSGLGKQQKTGYLSDIHLGLANTLSANGKDETSLQHYKTALDLQTSLTQKPSNLSAFYNGYGHALRHTGKYQEAIDALTEGLILARQSKSKDNLDIASALNQLASTYRDLGNYPKALEAAQEGLEIRQKIHQSAHPEVVASMGNVSNIFAKLGDLNKAIEIRVKMRDMLEKLVGKQHAYYGANIGALAAFQLQSGNLNAAKFNYQQMLTSLKAAHPEGNYNIARPLMGLGQIEREIQHFSTSLDYFRQAVDITDQYLKRDHVLKATASAWYSLALRDNSQLVEAERFKQQALDMQQRLFGLESKPYLAMYNLVNGQDTVE